jgi:hypothetical protein
MFEYYANSMMAEVLRAQDEFDILHFHLSTAWLPLAATARTPSLFTMHTCVHLDDEWVMRRWPQVAVNGISRCQMHGAGLKLGREFPIVYNGCDFSAYEPSFEPGKYLAFPWPPFAGEKSARCHPHCASRRDADPARGPAAERRRRALLRGRDRAADR